MGARIGSGPEVLAFELPGGRTASADVYTAATPAQRLLGLAGPRLAELPRGCGLLFERCSCVHTIGMRGPVSLTWLGPERADGSRPVVSVDSSVPPLRVVFGPRGAEAVIEARPLDASLEHDPPAAVRLGAADGKER